jgi:hypothetical protein
MNHNQVNVGFCVAYDWSMLKISLPLIYAYSDKICLSIDAERISWSGNQFNFDENEFNQFVKSIDVENKIHVYQDNFHLKELTPMENEVRQRNMIASVLGKDGWHIQLDCDEYFLNFKGFVQFIKSIPHNKRKRINVSCPWLILFKENSNGIFYINPLEKKKIEFMQIATTEPAYEYGRRNGNFNIHTNFLILHQSWARPEDEIVQKINNWGHSKDFDKQQYINFWKSVNEFNYKTFKNVHWLHPENWPRIEFISLNNKSIPDLTEKDFKFPFYSPFELMLKNSLILSRIKKVLKKIRNLNFS